ncbi:ATP synthase mitochondrial F1 complex assembly factor 2 [Babesia caballi]|uniref:ATP synthase mitochondrial F1 complex assembly factor 2 n=1 Tax=Babesia caballi TaxID=5871 RepID=A0AAV4M0H8_BABCB|nr:ATP synthase mitochondrial F1 complex assembly factor 2 [Babesia caballi]
MLPWRVAASTGLGRGSGAAGARRCLCSASPLEPLPRVRLHDKVGSSLCRHSAQLLPTGSRYAVLLDGRLLESPLGNVLSTASLPVAERVVSEWREQRGRLTRFESVPTTMLLAETVDLRPGQRAAVVDALIRGLDFDTALRFDPRPAAPLPPLEALDDGVLSQIAKLDLDVLQSSYLTPILGAFAARRRTSPLTPAGAIGSCPRQPDDVLAAVYRALASASDAEVTALHKLHRSLKSVILPLELLDRAVEPARAVRASRLEETLQAAAWGACAEFREHENSLLLQIDAALHFQRAHADPTPSIAHAPHHTPPNSADGHRFSEPSRRVGVPALEDADLVGDHLDGHDGAGRREHPAAGQLDKLVRDVLRQRGVRGQQDDVGAPRLQLLDRVHRHLRLVRRHDANHRRAQLGVDRRQRAVLHRASGDALHVHVRHLLQLKRTLHRDGVTLARADHVHGLDLAQVPRNALALLLAAQHHLEPAAEADDGGLELDEKVFVARPDVLRLDHVAQQRHEQHDLHREGLGRGQRHLAPDVDQHRQLAGAVQQRVQVVEHGDLDRVGVPLRQHVARLDRVQRLPALRHVYEGGVRVLVAVQLELSRVVRLDQVEDGLALKERRHVLRRVPRAPRRHDVDPVPVLDLLQQRRVPVHRDLEAHVPRVHRRDQLQLVIHQVLVAVKGHVDNALQRLLDRPQLVRGAQQLEVLQRHTRYQRLLEDLLLDPELVRLRRAANLHLGYPAYLARAEQLLHCREV